MPRRLPPRRRGRSRRGRRETRRRRSDPARRSARVFEPPRRDTESHRNHRVRGRRTARVGNVEGARTRERRTPGGKGAYLKRGRARLLPRGGSDFDRVRPLPPPPRLHGTEEGFCARDPLDGISRSRPVLPALPAGRKVIGVRTPPEARTGAMSSPGRQEGVRDAHSLFERAVPISRRSGRTEVPRRSTSRPSTA
jgi:hypothetical protein